MVPQHPIAKQSRPNARVEKGRIVDEIIEALTVHTYIENESMYPEVRDLAPPDLEDDILESYEEHHVADVLVVELAAMEPDDERFDAKTTVLIESVEHHIEEEEQEWYPKVREELGRKQLQEMSARMLELRDKAPRLRGPSPTRRPHAPHIPCGRLRRLWA
ncbi:hemerythrin domain-containing protein [Rhodococcus opacus]|nr:hemerythrin domain-containing protein [Rhodococcus opacus]